MDKFSQRDGCEGDWGVHHANDEVQPPDLKVD